MDRLRRNTVDKGAGSGVSIVGNSFEEISKSTIVGALKF